MTRTYFTQQAIDGSWHVVFRDAEGGLQSAHHAADPEEAKAAAFVMNVAQPQEVEVTVL